MKNIRRALYIYDWNFVLQELCTFMIGASLTVIYLAREYDPSRNGLILISLLAAFCISLKSMIYSRAINFNDYKGRRTRGFKATSRHYAHEFFTILLAITFGCYAAPVFLSFFLFEEFWYPKFSYGLLILIVAGGGKLLVASGLLDGNSQRRPKKAWRNWPAALQIIATAGMGIIIGFYLYISGILFIPAEDNPQYYAPETFEKKMAAIRLFVKSNYLREQYEYKSFSQLWQDPVIYPYLVTALLLITLFLAIKIWLRPNLAHRKPIITQTTQHRRTKTSMRNPSGAVPRKNASHKLAKTQEHKLYDRKLAKTQEYRIKDRKPAKTQKTKISNRKPTNTSNRRPANTNNRKPTSTGNRKPVNASRKLAKTQEYRITNQRMAKTREYKISRPLAQTQRRPALHNQKQRPVAKEIFEFISLHGLEELFLLLWGIATGLFIVPMLKNAYFYKLSVYPPYSFLLLLFVFAGSLAISAKILVNLSPSIKFK